uniref:Uncharacterized protein n=1 Tax=Arundo donax TaxID=35708 RepID=A0A0A9C4Y0_ARUDO
MTGADLISSHELANENFPFSMPSMQLKKFCVGITIPKPADS